MPALRYRQCDHRPCDRGRLNISSIDPRGHGFTPCHLFHGHEDAYAMAECMREVHAAQGSDLGPWQLAAEAQDLANEIRERRGETRIDYKGEPNEDLDVCPCDAVAEEARRGS